jgi:hypothetical protein
LPRSIENLENLQLLCLQNNHLYPWPTEILQPLLDKTPPTYIIGQNSQTPAPQSTQPISFFKKIGSKIKFAFRKLFQKSA